MNGWFDEQIRLRAKKDQDVFEDSFIRLSAAVLGKKMAGLLDEQRMDAREVIDQILVHYHYKPRVIPQKLTTMAEQLEYALRPYGLMYRAVDLTEGWYKNSFGPVLAFDRETQQPVALLPGKISGYVAVDPDTGVRKPLTKKYSRTLDTHGLCFYHALPQRKLGIKDLIVYIIKCISLKDIVSVVLFTLASTLVTMIVNRLIGVLTGPVLASGSLKLLMGMAIFMLCSALSAKFVDAAKTLVNGRMGTKVSLFVEAAVMMRLMSLPARFFREYNSGELSSRTSAVSSLCDMLLGNVFTTSLTSVISILYIGQIFELAPALVVPAIVIILSTVIVNIISVLMQVSISRKRLTVNAKENALTFALISGIQKIKLAGAEKRSFARWARVYADSATLSYNPPMLIRINNVVITGIGLVGNIVLYYLSVKTGVKTNEYYAFTAAYSSVMGAFTAVSAITYAFAQIPPILEMAAPILETVPETSADKEILTSIKGGVEIDHVSFRYDDNSPMIIKDLKVRIHPGEYVAIVGKTGCGKTTLIRLLLGFEQPVRGTIRYDGKDISQVELRSLRKKIGVVTQDGGLFQGSIYENIAITKPDMTLSEAWEAAEIASIADDIRAMPMGMFTVISEGQGGISGGQKQRLMIARAVGPKPKLLIFDEATSALDNQTQRKVCEALDKLDCTRIVIAHRLSTIRHCDRILVLSDGHIQESGTYNELIAKGGIFADLVARQRLDKDLPEDGGANAPKRDA